MTYLDHYQSPLGGITISSNGNEITGLWFDGQKYFGSTLPGVCETKKLPVFEETKKWLDLYFSGKAPDFTPPLKMETTPFRRAVWEIMLTIPYGQTMTYGEIAKRMAEQMGLERMSAQAVGGAVGHNAISLMIPCHRVVGTNGSLTGYAGGIEKKMKLLTMEHADLPTLFVPKKGLGLAIVPLPKEEWEGTILPMRYTTEHCFDLKMERNAQGYEITFHKQKLDSPVTHVPEAYDFSDRLYQPHWEKAYAWGIVSEQEGTRKLLACIETCPEEWSNRLMVTELWVHEKLRRQGIGHRLMAIAKEQAWLEHRRALILETQSCNTGAICFYEQEGFSLIGFDSCCYSNRDRERKEIRLDMGCFFRTKGKEVQEGLVIRREQAEEYHETEQMVLWAFWNKYRMGCEEHFLVHKLRESDAYLPELSKVAVVGGEVVGAIFYAKAWLKKEGCSKEILVFGPLCVSPKWQGCGIGSRLLTETLARAKESGYEGVVIFGEPDYYPRHGFQTCDHFGITTWEGENFDAFLGLELVKGGLGEFGGRFYLPEVFGNRQESEIEAYTKAFQTGEKQKFPGQFPE